LAKPFNQNSMKHFLSVKDVPDVQYLLGKAAFYKSEPLKDKGLGNGKRIGLIFLNPSLRTRISTQIAASNLGLEAIIFDVGKDGWALEFGANTVMNGNTAEHIRDAAPVLGSYFDILCIRSFPLLEDRNYDYSEQVLNSFIQYSGVPVVSLESATLHPLQSFADLITIQEEISINNSYFENRKPKIVLSWAPHIKPLPQCVPNSFAQWINKWGGAEFTIVQPEGFELTEAFTAGAEISFNQQKAIENADFIYVKNWSSYQDYGRVGLGHEDWMLSESKLEQAPKAKIMHCLPVRRNVEISDDLLDSQRSLVQSQAQNRVWAAQAILSEILKSMAK
jgi:N-succinyl-L-ornithine transcarbamylase